MKVLMIVLFLTACGKSTNEGPSSYAEDARDKVMYVDEPVREKERMDVQEKELLMNLDEAESCTIKFPPPAVYNRTEVTTVYPQDCYQVFDNSQQNQVYMKWTVDAYAGLVIRQVSFYNEELDRHWDTYQPQLQFESQNFIETSLNSTGWGRYIGSDRQADSITLKILNNGMLLVPMPTTLELKAYKIPPQETDNGM